MCLCSRHIVLLTFPRQGPVCCPIGGFEEKPWRPRKQARFLSLRLTAARLPSAGGEAVSHTITVRSTGLSERRRKLLQVPCRSTRFQRTDARSNTGTTSACSTDKFRDVLLEGIANKHCDRRGKRCRCVWEEGAQPLARRPGHRAAWRRTSRIFDIDPYQRSARSTKGLRRRQRLSAMHPGSAAAPPSQ